MYKSEITINALEIRDTNAHNGSIINAEGFSKKTLIIENGLNQEITLTCEGSAHPDFSNKFEIGSFPQAANTNDFQTCDAYIPFWRVVVQCETAPTSGSLTIHLERIQ